MLKLTYAIRTHPGNIRENNEDNFYWNGRIRSDVNQKEDNAGGICDDTELLLAAVCDGMGGESKGEIASLIAVKNLKPCSLSEIRNNALANIEKANADICNEIEKNDGKRMGSTIAALYMEKGKAVCCNVGDSRVYLMRRNILTQISVDHSQAQQLISLGMLTQEMARKHKSRHVLTQYLGIFEDEMVISPTFSDEIILKDGDIYLLCSDGLTDMITDEDIRQILIKQNSDSLFEKCLIDSPDQQAELLVKSALENGGRDNITVIVIWVNRADIKRKKWLRMFDILKRKKEI